MHQTYRAASLSLLLVSSLLVLLAACAPAPTSSGSSSTAPTQAATSPSSPTVAAGTILYQANWSAGLAGWKSAAGWKVNQGQLVSDGRNNRTITAPYASAATNYAIEVHLQVARLTGQGGLFMIFAARRDGKDGYKTSVLGLGEGSRPNGGHPQAQILIDPTGSMDPGSASPIDYEPGTKWHTCRVEVRGNQAEFLIDGTSVSAITSNQTEMLSGGPIGIASSSIILRVDTFRVIAL